MSCPAPSDLLCSLLTAYLKVVRNVERCCSGTMNTAFFLGAEAHVCTGSADNALLGGPQNPQGEQGCQPSPGQGARRHCSHHSCTIIGGGCRDWSICMSMALGISYYKIKLSWLLIKSFWWKSSLYTMKTVRRHK